jgi:phage FluMu protein Com
MPIQFRCPACGGRLSIAKRKAGNQVACPKCRAAVTVPGSEREAATVAAPAVAVAVSKPAVDEDRPLFERDDFEALIEDAPKPVFAPAANTEPPREFADADDGILISRGAATALAVLMLVLLAMAFATGYLIGS